MVASRLGVTKCGIVDETKQRAELLMQAANQNRNFIDLAKIKRHKMERTLPCLFGDRDRGGDVLAPVPRDRDHAVASSGKLLCDCKAQSATAPSH